MKIAVLTDAESASGYRLAGMEAAVASDAAEAAEVLSGLIETDQYALIAVNAELLPAPHAAVKRSLHGRDLPVLITIPSMREAVSEAGEDAERFMRQLIKETMGYEIKL
ncbi:MAG: V-type ATP synthase subunit F [Desulfosarcinaceae bacterium]|jgi:V/A-type H+/Na+-transporting ATPase subunit F